MKMHHFLPFFRRVQTGLIHFFFTERLNAAGWLFPTTNERQRSYRKCDIFRRPRVLQVHEAADFVCSLFYTGGKITVHTPQLKMVSSVSCRS
jgi:hypothetical protein